MSRRCVPILAAAFIAALLSAGCATAPKKDYTAFRSENPRSILAVPVVNKSVEVTAADLFLSTLTVPLAERGYYVFPVDVVKHLLEDDGLSDPDLVHSSDTRKLCNLFGADSVLYVAIERWDAKYMVLSTQVTVSFDYTLKGCKTSDTVWNQKQTMVYSPQSQNTGHPLGNLIAMAVNAAITKAAPNYMPLARQANGMVFAYPGPGVPAGPYHPQYLKDDQPAN
jgi:hypothetical protein